MRKRVDFCKTLVIVQTSYQQFLCLRSAERIGGRIFTKLVQYCQKFMELGRIIKVLILWHHVYKVDNEILELLYATHSITHKKHCELCN
jgi:hypothetical protein